MSCHHGGHCDCHHGHYPHGGHHHGGPPHYGPPHYGPPHYGPPHFGPPHHGPTSHTYYWVDANPSGPLPPEAFQAGHDVDGDAIFVGRANHGNEWLPAKICSRKRVAYIAWSGKEHAKSNYQVLCGHGFRWIPSGGGSVIPGAVEGGRTVSNEVLYIGRVSVRNSLVVGKVHPSHRTCYIPFDGKELAFPNYEILVHQC